MSVESNEGDDVSVGSLASGRRPSWREAAHKLTAPSHNYVKDWRSKAPNMAQMSDMHSHFKISHAMWARLLNERVLHPRFVTLLRVGGLPPPGAAHSHFGIVYSRFLKFLFAMCIIVCTSRLFKRSRPACVVSVMCNTSPGVHQSPYDYGVTAVENNALLKLEWPLPNHDHDPQTSRARHG